MRNTLTHPEEVVELLGDVETLIPRTHAAEDLRDRRVALLAVLHTLILR